MTENVLHFTPVKRGRRLKELVPTQKLDFRREAELCEARKATKLRRFRTLREPRSCRRVGDQRSFAEAALIVLTENNMMADAIQGMIQWRGRSEEVRK